MIYFDERNGGNGKLTSRRIAKKILPNWKHPVDNRDVRTVSREMVYARRKGWVKIEKINEGKFRYFLTDSGRRYMKHLLNSGKVSF